MSFKSKLVRSTFFQRSPTQTELDPKFVLTISNNPAQVLSVFMGLTTGCPEEVKGKAKVAGVDVQCVGVAKYLRRCECELRYYHFVEHCGAFCGLKWIILWAELYITPLK